MGSRHLRESHTGGGDDAALRRARDGFQLYLIERGSRTEHPSGGIGLQYLIWATAKPGCERAQRSCWAERGRLTATATGTCPSRQRASLDGTRILVAHPRWESLPRSIVDARLYA